jgi:hypothetical protein
VGAWGPSALRAPAPAPAPAAEAGRGGAERARLQSFVVLCTTGRTSPAQRSELERLAAISGRGSRVVEVFDPNTVTHLISFALSDAEAAAAAAGAGVGAGAGTAAAARPTPARVPAPAGLVCTRTIKYVMAVLCGCWVVDFSWVVESLRAGRRLPEDAFEFAGDKLRLDPGVRPPRLGREAARDRRPPLLAGWQVFVREPLCRMTAAELKLALECAGAHVTDADPVPTAEATGTAPPSSSTSSSTSPSFGAGQPRNTLVVTSFDASVAGAAPRAAYVAAAKRAGVRVVDQLWFLDSVSRFRVEDPARWEWEGERTSVFRRQVL